MFLFYTIPFPTWKHEPDRINQMSFENGEVFSDRLRNLSTFLELVGNSEKPFLNDLSFVVEIGSGTNECDLAPAFKSLAKNCTGKEAD